MSILSIFKKKDTEPKQETTQQAAPKSSSSGSSNPFAAIIARETGGTPKTASSDKFKSPLSGSSSSSSPQFKAYSTPSKTGSITVKDKRTGKTVSYESTLTDKDRKELEAANPFKSMFRDTGTPSLSERSKENDRLKGIDWSTASDEQKAYNEVYYKTLDDPTHTKMYTDLEAAILGREDVSKDYKSNHDALEEELKTLGKDRGKDSYEYKALKAFIDSYEDLGRKMVSTKTRDAAAKVSRETDDTIDAIFSGVMNRPDFKQKAEEGKKGIDGNLILNARYNLDAASEKQRDMMYYIYATEGKEAAREFFDRFLGDRINYLKAAEDFANDMENESTLRRFWESNKANWNTAMSGIIGTGIRQTFTDTEADPNDRTILGDYSINDSIDDYLRGQIGDSVKDSSLKEYGTAGFAELQDKVDKDWIKDAAANASEYQKQFLGYIYMATGSKKEAREAWETLKQRGDAIWQTVNGSQSVANAAASAEGQMYRDYLSLGSADAPEWLGNPGGDESLTVAQALWDFASTTRAQYPQIAANLAGSLLTGNPMVGRVLGAAVMSIPAYGNEYKQAVDEGKDPKQAAGFAATQALMEFGSDMLLSGIAPIAGSLTNDLGLRFVKNISNPFLRALANSGVRALGEGAQEYIQEIATNPIRNLWFGEQNAFEPISQEAAYSFFLGAMSAFAMGPANTRAEVMTNRNFTELGKALNSQDSTNKLIDTILNNPVEGGTKEQQELYEEARKLAQKIKDGSVKATDINVGEVFGKYAKAGGDVQWLTDPATISYNKESIALEDMIAGATSMLSTLNGDVGLAESVAKLAMGQPVAAEMQEAINKSSEAQQVLTQLQGNLDMSVDNALTRAARATIFKGALNKIYTTLKNSNPEKNVVSPAVQVLYDSGVKINDAEKIGAVFNKVLDGQTVTAKEAKLVKASSPAIRAAALQILGLDLSEYAGVDTVLAQLNELASQQQTVKEQQADIKRTAKVVARARGAAMQGGFANGLRETDDGRPAEVSGDRNGTGLQGQVPGAVPEGSESAGAPGRAPAHLYRPGQRSGTDQERNEDVRSRGVIPADQLDEGQKKLHEALVSSGFDSVEFVLGEDSASGFNSRTGKYECKIRADGQFGQNQYADHEKLHLWLMALAEAHRKKLLRGAIDIFGQDFSAAFNFVKTLYDGKGYNDGLALDDIYWRTVEDMLCFANGGQNFRYNNQTLFDFSAYQDAVRSWAAENNLEAIGTGDLSNPAVREAMANGWINQKYYDRHGFGQEDSTEIDIGTESRAAAPRKVTPVRSQSTQRAMNNADVENLTRSVKNLRKERRRLIREAEQNGTRNSQEHREVINALNEQIEEYQSRIDDLTDQHSADYEEENYEERTADRSGVQGDVPGGETEVRSPERERDTLQKPKKNIGRKSERLLRESRDLHEDEVKNLVEFEDAEIVPDDQVPKEYRWIKEAFLNSAPDSDVTFYRDDSEYAYIMFTVPAVVDGADGGFFVNLAKLEAGEWADDGWTLDILVNHEKSHYWLDKGGKLANRAWKDLRNRLLPNANEYSRFAQILKAYRDWCSDSYHDAEEEMLCDIHAGRSLAFDVKAPELWPKVKAIVDEFFAKNTESDLGTPDSLAQHSADYDPEFFRSIGLISPDGSTAAFTDNINGVHEEILNQLNGTEGEDIKDFIARGGVRVKPGVGIEVNGDIAPTMDQYDVIDDVVENFDGKKFTIDFNIDGVFAGSHTLEGADIDPSRVYSYLRNYYARRKADIARDERLTRYAGILGMPVKTMKDAYNLAKFQIQMDEDNPELQEIIDTYENQRYSADYLNPESDDYLGPEIDATTMRNAQVEDVYRNQDMWLEDRESETDEDATGEELSLAGDEMLESQMDQLLAELDTFPERAEEIFGKIQELQEKSFNKTKHADEGTETGQAKQTKKSQAKAAPKKTPVQMAFQPKKAEAPVEETQPKAEKKPIKVKPIPRKAEPAQVSDNGVNAGERSAYEQLKAELEANPALAEDPAFFERAAALVKQMGETIAETTAAVEAAEAAQTEGEQVIVLKDDTTYANKDKKGEWWRSIGRADTVEIRRRRSDRNTYDVRITDRNGNVVVYDEVSPSMLTKAFGFKTGDRETAKYRANQAMALATSPSLAWSQFENQDVQKAEKVKQAPVRSKDNLGREVPARLSQYMEKSAIRTEDGALINTYRLASENGVHNAKIPGRFSMFMERPAAMNIQRGMSGAEAYGQSEKAAGEKLAKIFDKLADPKTSKEEVEKLRKQIAQLEEDNKKYVSGITRLDPFRPDFQFAQRENIVNGKSMLETYLDIRKPKVVDAKGQGLDFVQREVRNFINNPENKAGQFDANRDPIGPNDGFKFTNVKVVPEGQTLGGGDLDLDTVYVTFRNNQAKSTYNTSPTESDLLQYSADYVDVDTGYADGTLEDMILKVLWDKDEDRATAALTNFLFHFLQTGVLPEIENERTRNIFQPKVSPGQARILENQMAQFVKEFGPLEKGEKAARNVVFPRQTDDGYTRRVFRTAAESKNTPEWTMDALKREFLLGEGTYQRISDKSAIAYADREFQRKGYDKVLAEWQGKIDTDERPTKNDVAVGEMLFNEAVKVGDMETAMRTLAELADIGTTAGQTVQAFRMLKKMPKSYQLYYFQRVANRLNRQYAKRINSGKMQEIKLDTKLSKAVLKAKTQEELDAAMDALIKNIAEQIPVTMADKWNAWRYLSMLGNPKTHIRNVLGNAIFAPAKFAKDLIAAGLETTLISDPSQRVTSFKGLLDRAGTKEYRAFAEEDYEGIKTELQSGGKYNPTNAVLEARSIFKNNQLEKLRRLNGDWLEKEDGAFLKFHYVNALTNFLATKGMSLEELQGTKEGVKILNAARQYAFLEAQKATYRDASAVASALNSLKRVPGIGVLMEGLLPFTKTPINILKRGIEYSPIGLLDATTRQLAKLKNGEITANEFVDKLASGLTGTGIAILGFWLASQGLLRGGDDDDDKQADTDKLVGYQNYSINLGKTNFTIDWAAPSALPLFVGAAVFNELREKNGLSGADFYNALTVIAEPITQLSMLSGLNDTLKSAKWDDNPFASVIQSMGSGYLSQGIPTLLGQVARAATEDRRTTYVDKNSDVPQPIQRWIQTNVMGKIPGLNNQRTEYIDTWGRTDSTPGFIVRLIDNMFLPGYRNEINITPVDKELQRLADAVGTGVLVSPADRYIEFNNETHHLTADQYQTYAKVRGNQTFAMLTELFNSDAYASLSDAEKAKAVKALKDYGNVLGKQAVFPEYDPDTDNWAEKCDGDPTRLVNMALLKGVASEQGVTVSNNGKFYNLVINCDWLTPTEQAYAMAQQYTTTSQSVYISRSGHKWALTPERKQVLYQHVRDIYPAYYTELVTSSKWRKASESKRMELLKAMRDELSQDAKVWLARQLNKAGEK